MKDWIRREHVYNFFMYGKIGKVMSDKFENTDYRKAHRSITPEVYESLEYIRTSTPKEAIVVTPFVKLYNERNIAFYTSAFSERTAFLEGYDFGGVTKYVTQTEIKKKIEAIKEIYGTYKVPKAMRNNRYIFLVNAKTKIELGKRYFTKVLYENNTWSVLQLL